MWWPARAKLRAASLTSDGPVREPGSVTATTFTAASHPSAETGSAIARAAAAGGGISAVTMGDRASGQLVRSEVAKE